MKIRPMREHRGVRPPPECRNVEFVLGLEGGQVSVAFCMGACCVIVDESFWADFLEPSELVTTYWFASEAERFEWLAARFEGARPRS
jgi:hypothetical protein